MDAVLQYEIPVFHPLVVHFPIALILVGALTAVVWVARGTVFWRQCILWLFSLGLVGGIVAYKTGETLREHTEGTPIVEELGDRHEDMAFYTLLVVAAMVLLMALLTLWREKRMALEPTKPDPLIARLVLMLVALAAAALVAWTGHIGGTMVWGTAG